MHRVVRFVYDLDMFLPVSLPIRILTIAHRPRLRWNYPQLRAPYWRLYWNFAGTAEVILRPALPEAQTFRLRPSVAYILPPDTSYAAHTVEPIDHFYIHFTMEMPDLVPVPGMYPIPENASIAQRMINIAATISDPNPLLAAGLVLDSLGNLPDVAFSQRSSDPVVREVERRIESRPLEALDLVSVSADLGCSERTIRRRFREIYGLTPRAYAVQKRMEHACLLLHFSNMTIDEIAVECGFCDRYHFSRAFSQYRGMGPASFRRVQEALAHS